MAARTVTAGHGRVEWREIIASRALTTSSDWPGLEQMFQIPTRTRYHTGQQTERVRHGVTSLTMAEASPARLRAFTLAHWGIETGLHWVRDIAFREDESRVRKDHGAENMAVLRHIALNLLKRERSKRGARVASDLSAHIPLLKR